MKRIQYVDHADHMRKRRMGIGGSDAAAIMGINPHKSAVKVFLEKTQEQKQQPMNNFQYWGIRHEPNLVNEVGLRLDGAAVCLANDICQSEKYPWMICSPDGEGIDARGNRFLIEAKTTEVYAADKWGVYGLKEELGVTPITSVSTCEPPDYIIIQLMHNLIVGDGYWRYGIIPLLIGKSWFRYYISELGALETDLGKKLEADLAGEEMKFWEDFVLEDVLPPVDGSPSCAQALNEIYPQVTQEDVVDVSTLDQDLGQYEALTAQINMLSTDKDKIKNKIRAALGDHEYGESDEFYVSWKNQKNGGRRLSVKKKGE